MKTQFTVYLWENNTSSEPTALLPISAKMPLSAMIFAMQRVGIQSADYILVRWLEGEDTMETDFYNVRIRGGQVFYDRAVPDS